MGLVEKVFSYFYQSLNIALVDFQAFYLRIVVLPPEKLESTSLRFSTVTGLFVLFLKISLAIQSR